MHYFIFTGLTLAVLSLAALAESNGTGNATSVLPVTATSAQVSTFETVGTSVTTAFNGTTKSASSATVSATTTAAGRPHPPTAFWKGTPFRFQNGPAFDNNTAPGFAPPFAKGSFPHGHHARHLNMSGDGIHTVPGFRPPFGNESLPHHHHARHQIVSAVRNHTAPGFAPHFRNGSFPHSHHTRQDSGSAIVHNACPFEVHSNIVHGPRPGTEGAPEQILATIASGASLSHPFSHDPDMGISWKVWREDAGTSNHNPVQFEYTYAPGSGTTWFDLSMINAGDTAEWLDPASHQGESVEAGDNNDGTGALTGMVAVAHPFGGEGEGLTLAPQGASTGNCGAIVCPAGEQYCTKAYNTDDDHQAMRDCAQSVDLKLTLCG